MSDEQQPAPEWFWQAIEAEPAADLVEVGDAEINYLRWSPPDGGESAGKPGLLFVHGYNAHAHWWDFIAPRYAADYAVAALDLSGMGDSDHRDEYSADLYADEIAAVAEAAGLPEGETVLAAHSFGGAMGIRAMRRHGERFKGLVLLDSGPRRPDDARPPEPERLARAKLYPSAEAARARFRLQPPQPCANQFLVEHIARNSIEFLREEGGFGWKFDEEQRSRMAPYADLQADFAAIAKPCALIYGAQSEHFGASRAAHMQELLPHLEVTELADAQHHLFLDQPQAFMEALATQLAKWR